MSESEVINEMLGVADKMSRRSDRQMFMLILIVLMMSGGWMIWTQNKQLAEQRIYLQSMTERVVAVVEKNTAALATFENRRY